MSTIRTTVPAEEIDRLRALTREGAERAVNALADLTGQPCRMRGPMARMLPADRLDVPFVTDVRDDERRGMAGVFFEVDGGVRGVLAILLPAVTVDTLIDQLTGSQRKDVSAELEESALREVGNILVSHFVSALGDALGVSVLPSVPHFVPEDAASELASLLTLRAAGRAVLRLETEMQDASSEVRGLLVFMPDSE